MSDSGRDWGASSDESIRALNAAKRDAKIENAIEQLDSLYAATSTVIVENRFTPESPRCMSAFIAAIYESWPTISDELKRLRAFEHAMHSGQKSIVGLQAENDRLQQENAELNAKLDTEKRAAISIAVAALDTGCVKPESKGTVEAVNDISAEISRLRELAAEMADSMQTMHDMLNILDYPITTAVQSKAKELIRKAEGVVK